MKEKERDDGIECGLFCYWCEYIFCVLWMYLCMFKA